MRLAAALLLPLLVACGRDGRTPLLVYSPHGRDQLVLLERAGTSEHGSIACIYTMLVEGDDVKDPIGDTARSILDGHVVLSRSLGSSGHFPAIGVLDSVSRVSSAVTDAEQQRLARDLRRLLAAHRDVKDLVDIGAYVPGADPLVDRVLALRPAIDSFLRQGMDERDAPGVAWERLAALLAEPADTHAGGR